MVTHKVKSCGNAHAWCRVCRPDMSERLQTPKVNRRSDLPPCRNCGVCNACMGLVAPDGMKVCRKCGQTKPLDLFQRRSTSPVKYRNNCKSCGIGGYMMQPCSVCGRAYQQYRGDQRLVCNKCKLRRYSICPTCGMGFTPHHGRIYCSPVCQRTKKNELTKARDAKYRRALLTAYGGDPPGCVCCREQQMLFLSVDHINGGGRKQRQQMGGGGFATWLRRNNYPAGFQVLCHNCNMGRQLNGGVCPHKQ